MVVNAKRQTVTGNSDFPLQFVADCPASLVVDDLIYVTGPSVGGIVQVGKVDITNSATMPTIGIVTEKTTSTRCVVISLGLVNPNMSLSPGRYFVGASGQPTNVVPVPASGQKIAFQVVGYALDADRLIMKPELVPTRRLG